MKKSLTFIGIATVGALALSGCGAGSSTDAGDENTLTIAYQKTSSFHQLDDLMQELKPAFEAAHEGVTVDLQPIEAEQDQYFTKLALMNGSASTAPDVIYEDTFQVMSDAAAGYLAPMDEYLAEWDDWSQFPEAAQRAGQGLDGKTYGVSLGTDTRGIYFNKDIFAKAGLPADWQPTTWDEILDAARAVKAADPDVIPLNIYSGKAGGEMTTMQGFEMLLYGTEDTLYDDDSQKWITGAAGFESALDFYDTVYTEELGPSLDLALDAQIGSRVNSDLLPGGELAIAIDGSWLPGGWISGDNAWPEWESVMGLAKMPTENGQGDKFTSMSGGWLLSLGANAQNPDLAMEFITMALNQENALKYDQVQSQIAVRDDVASDPAYLDYNPSFEFFADLVQYTHFRPATPDYSQISSNIQVAVESVVTGQSSPADAASVYDEALVGIVGEDATEAGK